MITRAWYEQRLTTALRRSPVTALLGPRQAGKTTLARRIVATRPSTYFDLESVPDRLRLQNPELVLGPLSGLVVLDEIQAMPELYPVLRVLADRLTDQTRFLILGSASSTLVKDASESMAGRVEFIELAGLDLSEVGPETMESLWLRGGFPRSYLADSDEDSFAWREGFVRTFLERDLPQLGITIPATAMRRFWSMLAHYHGQTWNGAELSRSLGLSAKTVRSYLDILTGAFMLRQLQPWYENLSKRQVRSPKVYFRDSGLLHSLLGLPDRLALLGHPKVGASWEGFAIEQLLTLLRPGEAYFWATHGGAELDLLFMHRGRRYGIEAKFTEAPVATPSMRIALEDLGLEHLWVVHPGRHAYPIGERLSALPLAEASVRLAEALS